MLNTARSFVTVILGAFLLFFAAGQGNAEELRVATRVLPPLVVDQKGAAHRLQHRPVEHDRRAAEAQDRAIRRRPTCGALLDDVRAGKADVGVAAISITAAREAEFDFSQPILNAGLQIMVRGKGQEAESNPLRDLLGPAVLEDHPGVARHRACC